MFTFSLQEAFAEDKADEKTFENNEEYSISVENNDQEFLETEKEEDTLNHEVKENIPSKDITLIDEEEQKSEKLSDQVAIEDQIDQESQDQEDLISDHETKAVNTDEENLELGEEIVGENQGRQNPMGLFEKLKSLISKAKDDEEISLEEGDYNFTEALEISKKVRLKNNGNVKFKRSDNYTGAFFNILKNGSLDLASDDENFSIDGEGKESSRLNGAGLISVEGELILNGVIIENDNYKDPEYASSRIAPIKTRGESARIVLNSGKIRNNDYSGAQNAYTAGAIYLTEGSKMVMKGGEISNNQASNYMYGDILWSASPGAGAIYVGPGAEFIMNGGLISKNKGGAGGVLVGNSDPYVYDRHKTNPDELENPKLSKATFNGGTISENIGKDGGGIQGFGNVDIKIPKTSTLLVTKNLAYQGGGILISDYYVQGDMFSGKKYTAQVSPEDWSNHFAGKFLMEAGTVSENTAIQCGGGINISSNGAKITGGKVLKNIAYSQGGGIYLTATPYILKIENAYITKNTAFRFGEDIEVTDKSGEKAILPSGRGGGVWFCPTGDAKFYAEAGAIISENDAGVQLIVDQEKGIATLEFDKERIGGGDDFWSANRFGQYKVTLPERLPNGAKVAYYEDNFGNRYKPGESKLVENIKDESSLLSLKAIIEEGSLPEAYGLMITENMAPRGGGIGTNGTIIFGKLPEGENPLKNIEIEKVWDGVAPEDIEVEVRLKFEGEDYLIEKIKLTNKNNYKYDIKNLPAKYKEQDIEKLIYLKELTDKYKVDVSEIKEVKGEDPTVKSFKLVLTNKSKEEQKFGNLIIEKKVIGDNTDEKFEFIISLKDQDGVELKTLFDYVISNLGEVLESGKIKSGDTFKLGNNDKIKITKIPYGSKYLVEELNSEGYKVIANNEIGKIDKENTYVTFTNEKEPENPPEEPKNPPEEPKNPPEEPKNPPEEPSEVPEEKEVEEKEYFTKEVVKENKNEAPKTYVGFMGFEKSMFVLSSLGLVLLKRKRK